MTTKKKAPAKRKKPAQVEEIATAADNRLKLDVYKLVVAGNSRESILDWIRAQESAPDDPLPVFEAALEHLAHVASLGANEQIAFCIEAQKAVYRDAIAQNRQELAHRALQEIAKLTTLRGDTSHKRHKLTPKERDFCNQYANQAKKNGTEAAAQAGFGGTRKSQATYAQRLLGKVEIQAEIERILERQRLSIVTTAQERREILSKIERSHLYIVARHGDLGTWLEAHPEDLKNPAIAEIETENTPNGTRIKKVKLRDPIAAIREHNLMDGDHAAKDVNLRGFIADPTDHMTDEQLREESAKLNALANKAAASAAAASAGETPGA